MSPFSNTFVYLAMVVAGVASAVFVIDGWEHGHVYSILFGIGMAMLGLLLLIIGGTGDAT